MRGAPHLQAVDYARFQEEAPSTDLSELTATIVVEDCVTPFGLIHGEVDVAGEGEGWFISDVRIADEDVSGKVTTWFSLGSYGGMSSATHQSPLRCAYAAMVEKVDDDSAISALLAKMG